MKVLIFLIALCTSMLFITSGRAVNDTPVCHHEGNGSYHLIYVAAAGAFNGHMGASHQDGLDVIPPFEFQGAIHSQRWDAEGQAIFAECDAAPTDTPTDVPTDTPTEAVTDTPTATATATDTVTATESVEATVGASEVVPTATTSRFDTPQETVAAAELPQSGVGYSDVDYTNLMVGLLAFAAMCAMVGLTLRYIRK